MIIKLNDRCGLCNRLRVIMFFYSFIKEDEKLTVIWIHNEDHGMFDDFFEKLPRIDFVQEELEAVGYKGNGNDLLQHGVPNPGLYKYLKLKSTLVDEVQKLQEALDYDYIAVHICRTDHSNHAKKNNAYTSDEEFIKFINKYPEKKIFIATDNRETFIKFQTLFSDRVVIDTSLNFSGKGRRQTSAKSAVIDLYMCIGAKVFMGSGHSSFSDFITDNRIISTNVNPEPKSVCLLTRFKNERHIFYEWVNHHLQEGVDKIFMIDHQSDDDFLNCNPWLESLINDDKVELLQTVLESQYKDYNIYLNRVKKYDWVIQLDMDEFIFSPKSDEDLKQVLNSSFADLDYIRIKWKLFSHQNRLQPKSVIDSNLITHYDLIDPSSPMGMKCIARTRNLESISIHAMEFNACVMATTNCLLSHNKVIEINHYRTQSDEYLYGVKEQRGGGTNKDRYKKGNFIDQRSDIVKGFDMKDQSLKIKRAVLINDLNDRKKVELKIYPNSTWMQTDVTKKAMHSKVNVLSKLMKWVGSRIKTR